MLIGVDSLNEWIVLDDIYHFSKTESERRKDKQHRDIAKRKIARG